MSHLVPVIVRGLFVPKETKQVFGYRTVKLPQTSALTRLPSEPSLHPGWPCRILFRLPTLLQTQNRALYCSSDTYETPPPLRLPDAVRAPLTLPKFYPFLQSPALISGCPAHLSRYASARHLTPPQAMHSRAQSSRLCCSKTSLGFSLPGEQHKDLLSNPINLH